ncbi:MAG: L-threonylcarbamoyladenylate synthase [Streptosporangiaceae bacterium]|jgi:tRNA threonylcarbamoyl adenosine modification protein (Sua5/YciO/YrdC/YwlC family)
MSARFDCADPDQRIQGLAEAETALRRGELVVIPTDTVYGIAAEAFDPVAVEGLLKAKGRGRDMPPPVLVGTVRAAMALVMDLGAAGKDLIDEFWPGALTIICRSSPTLVWDLGDTKGTVAVRMPLHPVALELLKRTGPLAVSSANVSGRPPATSCDEAMAQLGDSVSVYLDAGPCPGDVPSTIVDLTGTVPRLLRRGVIPAERLRDVILLEVVDEAAPEDPAGALPEDPAGAVPEDPAGAVPEDPAGAVAEDPAGAVAEDAPVEVFHDLPAGIPDDAGEAAVTGEDAPGEAAVTGQDAPGEAVRGGEDVADQANHARRDAAE